MTETRFGYLALLGCPNAGKSTLMNSCLGLKIAGVSSKPQTTRNRIVGVIARDSTQIGLLDTPGIQTKTHRMGAPLKNYMNKEAWGAARDADVICYLIDGFEGADESDWAHLKGLLGDDSRKIFIVLSKVDRLNKARRAERCEELKAQFAERLPGLKWPGLLEVSAKQKESVSGFVDFVAAHMPEGPHLYASETVTDRSPSFVCSELIREQLFRQLGQELPYSTAVTIDSMGDQEQGELTQAEKQPKKQARHIMATIYVPKDAHKGMVIGKGGRKLKEIGSAARTSVESYLNEKVFLELFVKVQEGWLDRDKLVQELVGPSYD